MPSPSLVLLRTQSDARLVALARDGHERAFEAIVERYRRQLLRSCRRVLPEGRAEDALQQTLMAAWRGLERGDEVRELRPWLHRIAHNTSLNLLRQTGYDYDALQESLRIADAPDDELERRAVVRQALHGLASLPPRQRDALLAIAVEGRSQEEVAGELGLSPGALRQLVHRARSALRAAATVLVPLPLVSWTVASGSRGELATRIAELSAGAGGAGAAAALAKAGTVAVIAGGAVAGPALIEKRAAGPSPPAAVAAPREARAPATAPRSEAVSTREPPSVTPREPAASRRAAVMAPAPAQAVRRDRDDDEDEPHRSRSGPSEDERDGTEGNDHSGPSGGDDDHSGPSGGDEPEDRSGPSNGDGPAEAVVDNSGPSLRSGSSGSSRSSGSSGPGSGSDTQPPELATSEPVEEPDSSGSGSGGGGSSGSG